MGTNTPQADVNGSTKLNFVERIERMNRVMQVSCPDKLTDLDRHRVEQFQEIIMEEITEMDDLLAGRENGPMTEDDFVAFADWLGDIVVYTFSEARRWGIPFVKVLHAIMDSQDSKLDENGQPIHCPRTGKFLKGPLYKPPEEAIHRILFPQEPRPEEDDGVSYDDELDDKWKDSLANESYSNRCQVCRKPTHKTNQSGYCPDCYQEKDRAANR